MTAHADPKIASATSDVRTLIDDARTRLYRALHLRVASPSAPLDRAMEAERKTMRSHGGRLLSYYEDRHGHGKGRPLVLVHGVDACASAYEMRPLFERYRGARPVYALDLAGFGFSERGPVQYSPESYTDELVAFLARVKDKDGDAPDVVALSLGCEFVARAALARKDLVHRLSFISPTGLGAKSRGRSPLRTASSWARTLTSARPWGSLVFNALVSRPSIHHYLAKSFVGPVDPRLAAYAHATAHQPGAEHAPLAFLRGDLFTPGIFDTYAALERPVLVVYDHDAYVRFDRLDELIARAPLWSSKRIASTRGMPQFDRLDDTAAALDEFWAMHAHHQP
jgi:pimeloyl-ACP methyl ester carboxylesterase